jgi:hypothetical protein
MTCKDLIKNKGIFFIAASIILFIPCALNYILQLNTPVENVIGGINGPTTWLAFWSAYIGAIGSTIIAYVSYYQSRKESARTSLRTQIERERHLYNQLENLIVKDVSIHSVTRVYEIKSAYNDVNIDKCNALMAQLIQDIHFASLDCVSFHNIVTSEEYMRFGKALALLNLDIFDIVSEVKYCDEKAIDTMLTKIKDLNARTTDLIHLGHSALLAQHQIIIDLENKLANL